MTSLASSFCQPLTVLFVVLTLITGDVSITLGTDVVS
ncbi:MAG: hypothetical protein QOE96_514 [Blastocatellia bacterium]|nr:hypothetical protein [Blastocatellia bacterium]